MAIGIARDRSKTLKKEKKTKHEKKSINSVLVLLFYIRKFIVFYYYFDNKGLFLLFVYFRHVPKFKETKYGIKFMELIWAINLL